MERYLYNNSLLVYLCEVLKIVKLIFGAQILCYWSTILPTDSSQTVAQTVNSLCLKFENCQFMTYLLHRVRTGVLLLLKLAGKFKSAWIEVDISLLGMLIL